MSLTESKLNGLLDHLQKVEGSIPSYVLSIHHIKDCPKKELKELAEKLNIQLIIPENNYYSDCYTMTIDVNPNCRILVHSTKVEFECKEVEDEK